MIMEEEEEEEKQRGGSREDVGGFTVARGVTLSGWGEVDIQSVGVAVTAASTNPAPPLSYL